MAEKIKYSPEGWTFYGEDFGGKVDGLIEFEKEKVEGLEVTPGIAIGASYFREFVHTNNFSQWSWRGEVLENGQLPESLDAVNRKVLANFQVGDRFAIRSSVVGENAGVGVYSTYFMVRTPDLEADMVMLGDYQKLIYSDFFTFDSREFLGDQLSNPEVGGVGLLIQPLIGDEYGEFFMPAISGVATSVNGELALRLVLGLGTKAVAAVALKEAIVIKDRNLDVNIIKKALFASFFTADAVDEGANLKVTDLEYAWKKSMVEQADKLANFIARWKTLADDGHPHYAEFAIAKSVPNLQILQIHPEKIIQDHGNEFSQVSDRLLCESTDVVNQGKRRGRGIFVLGLSGTAPEDLGFLADFNHKNHDFLLVVNDQHFSRATHFNALTFRHFSNAAGVIERQYIRANNKFFSFVQIDHVGRGGTHFTQLCQSRDILFQGIPTYEWDDSLKKSLGVLSQKVGLYSGYFDLEFEMTNLAQKGRTEIFGETTKPDYSREEFLGWVDELRVAADMLQEIDSPAADAFYIVSGHMVFALGQSVSDYQPLNFIDQLLPTTLEEMFANLEMIKNNLYLTESYSIYQEGIKYGVTEEEGNVFELRDYLLKLQSRVKERLAML